MKFTVNRNLFVDNLNNVMHAISSRATIPILSGIKLNLTEDELLLTGSDSDISIEIRIPVSEDLTVESTGAIVLPARFFSEIIRRLPGKEFSLEVKESFQTQIISENSEFTINGLDANNYPRLPEIPDESSFIISGKTFREIINETQFAVATQESRLVLTGVHFDFGPERIHAVATDSHRLSSRALTLENGPQAKTDLIIPGKSLLELARIIGETDPEIKVCPGENQVLFEIGNILFYSRLLEGSYPDTERLIPSESTTSVEFDLAELSSALDRASLLTHAGRNNVVDLTLDTENQTAKLSGESAEIGNVEEDVAFKKLEGKNLKISFNPDYLRDALRASVTDSVVMEFTQPLRPFTVNPDKDDIDFVQLITPVRTF
ncbi:DNA polymerase III subunit beta [Lactobacillus panisapium]|uniref:Beta sliding clamp n=1 Tax=Lactobacillus panisapium TaxID=2012495 RepID=A0ABX8W8M4_9LACO|nr:MULTISPECIES: DNA polymerase III subunit beta [Lactobacillus]MCT6807432.1 DNA polymerase III subunit beta [Bombilactobacillus sp.]MCO6531463.1 DNA polymerase III subunit beta [Lactobacillus sp.]MCO6536148.1 DNA polymerase III subunit beta [Lactobacillus sp.]MCT6854011.1 DNA polymerase III subunit beta [Lactobacillus panisapium]MCX8724256.1 DNA polymerase III subunit beta [Lactobacillus sp. B4005]